jgi:hypothetical protein
MSNLMLSVVTRLLKKENADRNIAFTEAARLRDGEVVRRMAAVNGCRLSIIRVRQTEQLSNRRCVE